MSNSVNNKKIFNKAGFTIIEIMVAFTILVLAFISIVQAFPFGLSINKDSELATTASYLAQEKLEEVISLGYSSISVGEVEAKQRISSDPTDFKYNFYRQTSTSYVDSDLNDSMTDAGIIKITTTVFYKGSLSESEENYTASVLISEL